MRNAYRKCGRKSIGSYHVANVYMHRKVTETGYEGVHWIRTRPGQDPLQSSCTASCSTRVGNPPASCVSIEFARHRATSAAGNYDDYGSAAPRCSDRIRQFITGDGTAPLGETPWPSLQKPTATAPPSPIAGGPCSRSITLRNAAAWAADM
jgi:hypothetical protein